MNLARTLEPGLVCRGRLADRSQPLPPRPDIVDALELGDTPNPTPCVSISRAAWTSTSEVQVALSISIALAVDHKGVLLSVGNRRRGVSDYGQYRGSRVGRGQVGTQCVTRLDQFDRYLPDGVAADVNVGHDSLALSHECSG